LISYIVKLSCSCMYPIHSGFQYSQINSPLEKLAQLNWLLNIISNVNLTKVHQVQLIVSNYQFPMISIWLHIHYIQHQPEVLESIWLKFSTVNYYAPMYSPILDLESINSVKWTMNVCKIELFDHTAILNIFIHNHQDSQIDTSHSQVKNVKQNNQFQALYFSLSTGLWA
jgi:hypothetical protein